MFLFLAQCSIFTVTIFVLVTKVFLTFSAPSSFAKVEESSEHQNRSLLFIRGVHKVGYWGGVITPPLPGFLFLLFSAALKFLQKLKKDQNIKTLLNSSSELFSAIHPNYPVLFIRTIPFYSSELSSSIYSNSSFFSCSSLFSCSSELFSGLVHPDCFQVLFIRTIQFSVQQFLHKIIQLLLIQIIQLLIVKTI